MSESNDEGVIPLSRWRAALARARRGHKADAILSEPNAEKLVPTLPVQELYYAIKEVGLADAADLVALASPAQIQGFVDLDVWDKDQLDVGRLNSWIEVLAEAGYEKLGAVIEALDPETVALWLKRQAVVYDLTMEQPPDEPEGQYFPTPDRFFLLDILPGGEEGKALERILDWIYRYDLTLGRAIVMSAKWELESGLEENSWRWRQGRMADLGYVDFYEALSIYRYLDPASVKIDEQTFVLAPPDTPSELPAVLAGSLDEAGFFGKALGTLASDADVEKLHGALVLLINKAMAADLVDPGDMEHGKEALARSVAYIGVGLEFLARGDIARAGQALMSVALERIFRVGVSLTLQLRTLTDTLLKKVKPVDLESPWEDVLLALSRRRPEFPRALDPPPAGDPGAGPPTGTRPFRTLADVARAAAALEQIAQIVHTPARE
ncbi:MAG: hypothetical protein JWN44_738 [Myxococcales bacterium]|nr:hypothetical protein [Myxococcales bacterium]